MRELTDYEKQLIEVLIKENESLRMVIKDSQLQNADPLANTTLIVITLKDILSEIKSLKAFLNIKTPSLAEEAKPKEVLKKQMDKRFPKSRRSATPLTDIALAGQKAVKKSIDVAATAEVESRKEPPPPFVQFQLTKENIAKLFTKPEEARSVIVQKLLDAGCAIGIDKLVEMGYIENVRRYECRMKVNG